MKLDDLISREAAKAAIRSKFQSVAERCEINEVLNGLPAVDAVPVVRCKDCKFWEEQTINEKPGGFGVCSSIGGCWDGNEFCSDGERRDT